MYFLRSVDHFLGALALGSKRITVEFGEGKHSFMKMAFHTFLFTTSEGFTAACEHAFVTIA